MKKVVFFLFLFILVNVNAKERVYVDTSEISGIISNRFVNGEHRTSRFLYISHLDKPIYCIRYGYPVSNNGYDMIRFYEYNNIDVELKDKIKNLIYYGYGYEDQSDIMYYVTTQLMIWEALGEEIYLTNGIGGSILNIDQYKERILNNIVRHDLVPDLSDLRHEYEVGKDIEIKDYNDLLKKYRVLNGGNLSIEGDRLFYKPFEVGKFDIGLLRVNGNQVNDFVFLEDNYQTLIKSEGTYNNHLTFEFNIIGTKLIVNRISDEEVILSDAVYSLYDSDGNLIGTRTTDSSGRVIFDELELGNYTLKEEVPSPGTISNQDKNITLEYGDVPKEIFIDTYKVKSNIIINIKYKSGDVFEKLNVEFGIYKDGNLIKSMVCDECIFENIEHGEYTIKQIGSVEGYENIEDFDILVYEDLKYEFLLEKRVEDINLIPQLSEYTISYIFIFFGITLLCLRKYLFS